MGFLTNCLGTTGGRCIGWRRRSKLQVRADALMATKDRERESEREGREGGEKKNERSLWMSFLVCDMLLPA